MRTAVVVGAGGAGREIAVWYRTASAPAHLVGYLDDDPRLVGLVVGDLPVLGDLSWLDANTVDDVVIGVGSAAGRAAVLSKLHSREVRPASVVHPAATIGERVTISEGTVVSPGVVITVDVSIGRGSYLNFGAKVGHDVQIGDCAVLGPGVCVAGNVRIERQAELGIGSSVLQGRVVGQSAVIGGGACVTRDIPAGTVAVGLPATPME